PVNKIRKDCPRPACPQRDFASINTFGDPENCRASQRRKHAIESQNHPRRCRSIDPENLENPGEDVWIYRCRPCAWAGIEVGGRAKSAALRYRAGQSAHFPPKLKVITPRS